MRLIPFLAAALATLSMGTAAQAQTPVNPLHERALQARTQQEPNFKIGGVTYQLVPDTAVVRRTANTPPATSPSARSTNIRTTRDPLASVGPFDIVPSASQGSITARSSTSTAPRYAAVVDMRTGQPVLLQASLQLSVDQPNLGQSLATALGGKLAYEGPTSLIVVVAFDSIEQTLAALPAAAAQPGVRHAQPSITRSFATPG